MSSYNLSEGNLPKWAQQEFDKLRNEVINTYGQSTICVDSTSRSASEYIGGAAMANDNEKHEQKVIQVVARPTPLGPGGWLWVEIINDKPVSMMWTPETPEEIEAAERFAQAIEAIDWLVPGVHEVRY